MLRRLVAGLPPRRTEFDSESVHVGFVVDKVALGQVFPRVLRFFPVSFIPPVLHYKEKKKKILIIFTTGLHNKPQGCGVSVASAAGPFPLKKNECDCMRSETELYATIPKYIYLINIKVFFVCDCCSSMFTRHVQSAVSLSTYNHYPTRVNIIL
jgi:hypothetical protein